ncbi:MAG: hypothetical protein ACYTFG_02575 [Planctomycetota bacterium]|jgi:hypothetical protein
MHETKWGYALTVITLGAIGLLVLSFTFNLIFYGKISSKEKLLGEVQTEQSSEVWEWQARHRDALATIERQTARHEKAEEEHGMYRALVGFKPRTGSPGGKVRRESLQAELDRMNERLKNPLPQSELTLENLVARLFVERSR